MADEAVRLSYPDWIVAAVGAELGDEAEPALMRMNEPAPVSVRDDGYRQDLASQWVAAAVEAGPGERVLDLCAAPGGKATAMAADGADVIAADLQLHRARLIRGVPVVVATQRLPPLRPRSFDKVLIDAPVQRPRRAAAPRRRAVAHHGSRHRRAGRVCNAASSQPLHHSCGPDGWLAYSVCTLTAEESIDHPMPAGFEPITERRPAQWRPYGHGWRVLPHDHDTDGMVLIRYRRTP